MKQAKKGYLVQYCFYRYTVDYDENTSEYFSSETFNQEELLDI